MLHYLRLSALRLQGKDILRGLRGEGQTDRRKRAAGCAPVSRDEWHRGRGCCRRTGGAGAPAAPGSGAACA